MIDLLIAAFWWVVSACFVAGIAASKHRSAAAWLLLGIALGPLAVIAAIGVPPLRDTSAR